MLLDYKVRVASMAMDFTDFSQFPSNVDVTTFISLQEPIVPLPLNTSLR